MNNEFEIGDLVSGESIHGATQMRLIGFISELRTTLTENGEYAQAKVMWVNGQHYWCPCYTLKLKQCK